MITHQEAEILTSARQDAPLDPMVERELQAHLATCAECRAFAAATERLTAGLKTMPTLPASPRVRREVLDRTRGGRGFAGFTGFSGLNLGPAVATLAAVLLIGVVGWFALDRVLLPGDNDGEQQIAAVPTEAVRENLSPTAMATETVVALVATDEPSPTPTDEPSPVPTETPAPTDAPTSTTAAPTATSESPTNRTVQKTSVTDLTGDAENATTVPTVPPTPAPTATTAPSPTPSPTVPPTSTPSPTPEPTAVPTNTPAIEPIGSTEPPTRSTETARTGQGSSSESPPIEPADGTEGAATLATGDDGAVIEGMGGDNQIADGVGGGEDLNVSTISLVDSSVGYTGIDGDPSGHLTLTYEGRLVYAAVPDAARFTTQEGYVLREADIQPGAAQLCGDSFCEPALPDPEDASWQGDVPLGVSGSNAWIMRLYADRSEIVMGTPQGTQIVDAAVMTQVAPQAAPATVYDSEGTLYAWLPTGEWLVMGNGSAQALPGDYPNPTNVRFAPIAESGPLMGYFSGNTLVIASAHMPGSALVALPSDGIDFDIQPRGDSVAVIRGNNIVIYDMQGNEIVVYEGGDAQPGSLIWLRGGIVWADRSTGLLYQIPDTAP